MKEPDKKEEINSTRVTSKVTIDFPSIGWGIIAGHEAELPTDERAKKIILANHNISIIK